MEFRLERNSLQEVWRQVPWQNHVYHFCHFRPQRHLEFYFGQPYLYLQSIVWQWPISAGFVPTGISKQSHLETRYFHVKMNETDHGIIKIVKITIWQKMLENQKTKQNQKLVPTLNISQVCLEIFLRNAICLIWNVQVFSLFLRGKKMQIFFSDIY